MFRPHHLEVFYYVVKSGGISAATRSIPYGIGQPAVSGHMKALEQQLGCRLFERRPFRVTESGRCLFARLEPFFDELPGLFQRLQSGPSRQVCLAASHLFEAPLVAEIARTVTLNPAQSGLILRTGSSREVEGWLIEGSAHVVLTTTDRKVPGMRSCVLARRGLRLLAAREAGVSSPTHYWRQGRVSGPLLLPGADEPVSRVFLAGLNALGVAWPEVVQVDSPAIMRALVAAGRGVGVEPDLPAGTDFAGICALPLPGFGTIPMVARWRRPEAGSPIGPLVDAALAVSRSRWGGAAQATLVR